MYCAGYVDAYATQCRIWQVYTLFKETNLYDDQKSGWIVQYWAANVTTCFAANLKWIRSLLIIGGE